MTNALYGPPQAPVDNALYYDDTQGMPRQRPADPLRWLADAVGQNKDLPAPQFFMDPRALSARNMLHSALNTSANWLDGTRDPSRIGPEEMVSPLGLAGMGTGLTNALGRQSRDWKIMREFDEKFPVEPKGDASKLELAKKAAELHYRSHVNEYGPLLSVDQAKHVGPLAAAAGVGSGLADQFIGMNPITAGAAMTAGFMAPHVKHTGDIYKRLKDADLRQAKETKPHQPVSIGDLKYDLDGQRIGVRDGRNTVWADEGPWYEAYGPTYSHTIGGKNRVAPAAAARSAGQPANDIFADNAKGSAPGLAANSTQQQDDQGVMSILRRYGLADDSTDMMRLGGPGSFKVGEPSPVQKTVFAGTNSATADHAALAEAKELRAMKERPEEIFRTTGWFQREDGVWRNEIDDSQSKLKELVDKPGERKLGDLLHHPDLFAAYPQLKDVKLVFSNMRDLSGKAADSPMADFRSMQPWFRGGQTTRLVRINLNSIQNKDPKTARDIVLHEVQHAIQDVEGDLNQDVMGKNAFVPYKDRLYEREGFEAQGRADMSQSERRNKTPGIADILKKYGLAD